MAHVTALSEFFLNSRARLKQFECLKIAHPNFTQSYYIVRNKVGGLIATFESVEREFAYYPLRITSLGERGDLDYALQIDWGELGSLVPMELDAIAAADGFGTKPTVTYVAFRSDDLTTPLLGPVVLEVVEFPMTREGTSFIAQAPAMNVNRTGEVYLVSRFPMLRGFL